MKQKIYSSLLLVALSFQLVLAQERNDTTSIKLSDIEVKAARIKLYSEMSRIISVINKEEITRSAVQSIDQLLDYVAGIDIRQRGTNATQADISIRGGSFDQVLVLLNGVNITDPQTGHFNLDIPLNLSDVSRVEILQGSAARVLGSNAFSGAINIVTESSEKPQPLNIELTGGSYNTFGQSVHRNTDEEIISISHKSSKGYMNNTDFELMSFFSQFFLATKNAGKFDLQMATQFKDFGANSFYSLAYPNQFESSTTTLAALNWSLTKGNLTLTVQGYWRNHHDRFELFRNFTGAPAWYKFHNYHLTDVAGGKASANHISTIGKTTLGVDLRNEHIFSNVLGTAIDSMKVPFEKNGYFTREGNRLVSTAFLDHALSVEKWYFSAGVAATNSASFGFNSYYGADVAYLLNNNVRVFANANSAVRLPTFTDIYYKSATQLANPDLQPEHSQTIEIGTKIGEQNWKVDASVYYRMGQNIIDWVKLPTETVWRSKNLTNVNALGTDISAEYRFNKFIIKKIGVAYSYLQMDKSADNFDSKYALDYLKNKVVLSFDHSIFSKLSASWKFSYLQRSGTYTDVNKVIQKFEPYALLDTRVSWIDTHFDIFADANNILNAKYADYGGLTQPGFSFNVGVRLKL